MADIRYVCLSDMHLGEEDSLLPDLRDQPEHRQKCSKHPWNERYCFSTGNLERMRQ